MNDIICFGSRSIFYLTLHEYGVCRLTFIRGANVKTSVCHRTYIYQDDVLLGSNK